MGYSRELSYSRPGYFRPAAHPPCILSQATLPLPACRPPPPRPLSINPACLTLPAELSPAPLGITSSLPLCLQSIPLSPAEHLPLCQQNINIHYLSMREIDKAISKSKFAGRAKKWTNLTPCPVAHTTRQELQVGH